MRRFALFRARGGRGRPSREKDSVFDLLLSIARITGITISTGEILYGVLAGLVFCAVLYLLRRRMSAWLFLDTVVPGFRNMVGVLMVITCAYMLRDINGLPGMPAYVIGVL